MLSPIGGAGFRGGMNLNINIQAGGGQGLSPLGGAAGGCPCPCGDGFSPSSELLSSGGLGFSPFGANPADSFAALLNPLGAAGLGSSHPGFSAGDSAHPWAGGIPDAGPLPSALFGGTDFGAFPSGLGGGGSLTSQALMMQAAASDANQAALIGAQTGAMGGLAGAQGTALAGINPLMSGLMANYG